MSKRVFISYSHDSGAHAQRVLSLADQLRAHGLDVRLDQYTPHPPEGWPRWMNRQLTEADFVLLICTPIYRRRFDGEDAESTGNRATWEGLIAQQILYEAGGLNSKLIPVIFADADERDIPLVLRPFARYRLTEAYDDLYRHLTGQPKYPAPPLGQIRELPPEPRPSFVQVDNRGASIGQQVVVSGTANFSAFTVTPPPPPPTKQWQILLLTASGAELPLEEELRAIEDALQRSRLRDNFLLRMAPAVSFARVIAELDNHAPDIVHFGGHGSEDGEMIFAGQPVAPTRIAETLKALRTRPKLVVFSLCHSHELASAAARHIDHAIGFDGPIEDHTTRTFCATFYERLASHPDIDIPHAFALARLAALASGHEDADRARLCAQS